MITLISLYLYALLLVVLGIMAWQYYRGTHDLLSFRNIGLFGFCVFQLYSGALGVRNDHDNAAMLLYHPVETGLIYSAMVTIFLVVFFWTYNRGFFAPRLAQFLPTSRAVPTTSMLWILAFILPTLGLVLPMAVPVYPFYHLASISGIAMAVAACGIAGWIWGPRLYNPIVIMGVAFVLIASTIIIMTGAFGRRPLVAAGAALLWGLYFSHFRYQRPAFAAIRLGVIALAPLILLALWTTAREQAHRDRSGLEQLRMAIQGGEIGAGLNQLSYGQGAGTISLWLIENHPEHFQTRYFHTLTYAVVFPVPRQLWPGKPIPLSDQLPHWMELQQVNRNALKLGPGLMGHVAAEGRWIALFAYALVAGLFFRFLDEFTWRNLGNPLMLVALGASFGQVIGFSRGETAAFVGLFYLGVIGVYITLLVLGKAVERLSGSGVTLYESDESEAHDTYGYEDYGEQEWDHSRQPAVYHRAGME